MARKVNIDLGVLGWFFVGFFFLWFFSFLLVVQQQLELCKCFPIQILSCFISLNLLCAVGVANQEMP